MKYSPQDPANGSEFSDKVHETLARKMRARRKGDQGVWFGFGMFGLVGWSVAIPALIAVAIGVWLDMHTAGPYSWTLMLLVLGIAVGCLNAWYWVNRERRQIEADLADLLREDESASAKEGNG